MPSNGRRRLDDVLAGYDVVRGYFYVKCIGQLNFARFQSCDKALSYTLSAFVRAGNIEDPVKLCRVGHQPWRAARIRGALLFPWPAIRELFFD